VDIFYIQIDDDIVYIDPNFAGQMYDAAMPMAGLSDGRGWSSTIQSSVFDQAHINVWINSPVSALANSPIGRAIG
jgi:hypothetical protein